MSPKKYMEQEELEVAKEIVNTIKIVTDGDSGKIFRRMGGVYIPISKNILNMLIVDEFLEQELHYNQSKKKNTIDLLKSLSFRSSKELEDHQIGIINLKNGIYYFDREFDKLCVDNETKESWTEKTNFRAHKDSDQTISFNQIPVYYDPDADCPLIHNFLIDVFGEDMVDLVYQYIGYLLLDHVKYQKAMIMVGAGKNGKSTFLDMLITFLGRDNIKQIPLQDLDKPFKLYNLKNITANIVADLPLRTISDTGNAKRIVTDNTLSGNIKNIQGDFNFANRCKMIYSCNTLPKTKDKSSAFYRRWLPFICSATFEGRLDIDILDKITSQEEMSGLFNRALQGIKELENNKGFPDTEEVVKTLWEMESNPVAPFIHSRLERIKGKEIKSVDLFTAINEYRSDKKEYLLDGKQIGYWLRQLGIVGITKSDIDPFGNPKRYVYYQGIKFKEIELKLKPEKILDTFGREI